MNLSQSPDYRETYANSVQVRVSVWDFQLVFGLASSESPDQVTIRNQQAIFLSPQQAKALLVLGQNLAQYEQAFGVLNPDGLEWARAKWGFVAKSCFRLMEWISLHAANPIIADAEAIASSLASRHGKLSACTVIPYGCEVIEAPPPAELLCEWGLAPEDYYLVVFRLEPENHVLEILQAFQQSHSNKQLIVVGNHLTGTSYVTQLRTVQDPRIRMIGTVYDSAKLTCLRYHSFAYMHGHSVGGTNPSLLEAMGCGNLIFAHDNPFNRETLGPCGYYFASVPKLTVAIDHAEQEDTKLTQLRSYSKSRARSNYCWPDIICKYAKLLAGAHS
jgi:glycosyltransferase involved in cell wall biosynthesis